MSNRDPVEYSKCRHCGVDIARFVRADCKWAHVLDNGYGYLACHDKRPIADARLAEPIQITHVSSRGAES